MTATDEAASTTTKRVRPHHLVIGLGAGVAVFTAISGIVPLITEWHSEEEVHREVFANIPSAVKLAFYVVIPVVILFGAFSFANRTKNWERGQPDDRSTTPKNVKRRMADFRAGV